MFFRVWDTLEKKMIDGVVVSNNKEVLVGNLVFSEGTLKIIIHKEDNPERYKVMLGSNIKDKAGTQIFEGDILESVTNTYDPLYLVVWTGKSFELKSLTFNFITDNSGTEAFSRKRIVGNIFTSNHLMDKSGY